MLLSPEPVSASRARRFVIDALHRHGYEALSEVAELLVSELVTNAILHARSEFTVRVRRKDHGVRVEVLDGSPAAPEARPYTDQATTGRGLELVEALAARWGHRPLPSGKVTWFELDRDRSGL